MPTEYNQHTIRILPSELRNLCIELAELVEETVRFGSHVLFWATSENAGNQLENLTSTSLLRHAIELLDAIPENLRKEQVTANKLMLRPLLDICFNMLYLVQTDTSRRAKAYLYSDAIKKIKLLKRSDPSSQAYQDLEAAERVDRFLQVNAGRNRFNSEEEIEAHREKIHMHESMLQHTFYSEVHTEYERLRAECNTLRRPFRPEWYSLFSGPKNILELARAVDLPATYEIFFRRYSGKVHPSDLINDNVGVLESGVGFSITPIRRSMRKSTILEIVGVACQISKEIYLSYVNKYLERRGSQVLEWYSSEIFSPYQNIKQRYNV